ncbi:toll/interleukin-1 receptor domain-containing protein [Nitrococcus mobilis]|uniref:TIR domain protein n=1 Tax=Nitrococcus mobilis Nb-231 TaxID=314278 RepID=A4BPP6_9GAMM|nr:toll/interleukin-1 receptor domain-containing protein [Nitrococcus mobilis]EAR22547.1 TIR domain protein [Nitrococcus mobilis Nb-231]
MPESIFLSHNVQDKAFVRRLAEDLSLAGVTVWLDEAEIKLGDSLLSKVEEGILGSDYLGVVLSPNSVGSEWVQRELRMALSNEIESKKVKVLPLLLADCQMPGFLTDKLYADFRNESGYALAFSKLADRLGVSDVAARSKDNWLIGRWNGQWQWRGQHRLARLEVSPSRPEQGRMIIQYSKAGTTTIVEQEIVVSVRSDKVDLIGRGYRFLERGAAVGYHLDAFRMTLQDDGSIQGIKSDKRGIDVPVRFERGAAAQQSAAADGALRRG